MARSLFSKADLKKFVKDLLKEIYQKVVTEKILKKKQDLPVEEIVGIVGSSLPPPPKAHRTKAALGILFFLAVGILCVINHNSSQNEAGENPKAEEPNNPAEGDDTKSKK